MTTTIRHGVLFAAAVMPAATGCTESTGSASCSGLVTYDSRGYLPPENETDFADGVPESEARLMRVHR